MRLVIPLTDLRAQYESIKNEIDLAVKEVIAESDFILGKEVRLLEEEICGYLGVKYAVGVASGTDALALALIALGVEKNDEVVTTPFTFIATSEAICRVGARPVFCDIDYHTYNINPEKIEERITSDTKAILPVHLYGMPCEMDRVMSIAEEYNLKVIEDCAQAFGSEYKGKKVASFGDCGCLSFFPAKALGSYGDGGMLVTNDEKIASMIKMLRNHGSTTKYYYGLHGFNSRLDTIQAAILRVKLKYLDQWISSRIRNANLYAELLKDADLICPGNNSDSIKHSFNYYTIRISKNRDLVQKRLRENGIAAAIYYPLSLHVQEVCKDLGYKKGNFPVAEQAQEEVLSLPMYPELTEEQIKKIVKVIKEIV